MTVCQAVDQERGIFFLGVGQTGLSDTFAGPHFSTHHHVTQYQCKGAGSGEQSRGPGLVLDLQGQEEQTAEHHLMCFHYGPM